MARSVGILSKLRYPFPSSALLLFYYSFIQPNPLFGLPLWGNANQSYLNRLQRLQKQSYTNYQRCNVWRHVSVSRHYFSKSRSRLGLIGLKPRSRLGLGTSKSRKMGKFRPYFQSERKNQQ